MRIMFAIVCIVAISAVAMAAGWDTNCWPLYEHWRRYDLAESNLVQQINARAGLWGGGGSGISFWRSRRSNLATLKTDIKSLVPGSMGDVGWVRYNVATNPVYWLQATNSLPAYSSIREVIADCRIPTNVLDYPPWRDLSGIGGFTNDINAVGRPHGVTNTYTARGGTNFPPGRSCWYTTDYGPDSIKQILEKLTTLNPRQGLYTELAGTLYEGIGQDSDLAVAKAEALGSFTNIAGTPWPRAASALYYDGFQYSARLRSSIALMECGDPPTPSTNYTMTARAFAEISDPDLAFGIVMDINIYDGMGIYATTGWNEVAGPFVTNMVYGPEIVVWMGITNAATVWPSPETNKWISRGWAADGNYQAMVEIDF